MTKLCAEIKKGNTFFKNKRANLTDEEKNVNSVGHLFREFGFCEFHVRHSLKNIPINRQQIYGY